MATMTRLWGGISMTDGVRALAEKNKCLWLVTDIAAYSRGLAAPFQVWTLEVGYDDRRFGHGSLTCIEDEGLPPIFVIDRIVTDIPEGTYTVWVIRDRPDGATMLLPEEY